MYLRIILKEGKETFGRKTKIKEIEGVYFVDKDYFSRKLELSMFLSGIIDAGMEIEWIGLVGNEGDSLNVKNYLESLRNMIEIFLSRQG